VGFDRLWSHLNTIEQQLESSAHQHALAAIFVAGAGLFATAGYLGWHLRNGYLLAGALLGAASVGSEYTSFDPLAVLESWEKMHSRRSVATRNSAEAETLQTMVG
jgi:hypothetical protein